VREIGQEKREDFSIVPPKKQQPQISLHVHGALAVQLFGPLRDPVRGD